MSQTLEALLGAAIAFRDARDWARFHTFKDLALGLQIEASELAELFLWKSPVEIATDLDGPGFRERVAEELADVQIFLLYLAEATGITLDAAVVRKLELNERKYPVDRAKGTAKKYTELTAGGPPGSAERDRLTRRAAAAPTGPRKSPSPRFARYVGIDYSGAETPDAGLPGLRVYSASQDEEPQEVHAPGGRQKHWTRRGIAEWLCSQLADGPATLVGLDHAFSFPLRYFEQHGLPLDWPAFLEDFQRHWPTDSPGVRVEAVRKGDCGDGSARTGETRWRRLTEERTGAAKSVFHFDVQGQVAKSTHAGLPWLLHLRRRLEGRVHFWPFDGWKIPSARSAVVEVYPRLWSGDFGREGRSGDQHDAFSIAAWMRTRDSAGQLDSFFVPRLTLDERRRAAIEGWILGQA